MWTAQLTYHAPRLDLDRRLEIVDALQASAAYDDDTGRLVLTFEVDGTTARQAADNASRRGGAAVSSAARGIVPARPTRILVLPTEEFIAETEYPGALELSGVAEIAELLGVSRQRVGQLIERDGFPAPIAELASGPVFTTPSIRAFEKRWEPHRRGGRPPRTLDGGAVVDHDGPPRRAPGKSTPASTH